MLLFAFHAGQALAIVDDHQDHPYQVILDRNPFGLRPPDPPPTNAPPVAPPSNIKLTGIAELLSQRRVYLMAVIPGKPKPEYYDFAEGEGRDGIEVLEINEAAGSVKIKNSGNVSTLTFAKDGIAPAAAPPAAAAPLVAAAPGAGGAPNPGAVVAPSTVVKMPTPGASGAPTPGASTVVNTASSAVVPGRPANMPTPAGAAGYSPAQIPLPADYGGTARIPTRNLRSQFAGQAPAPADQFTQANPGSQPVQKQLSVEEQIVLIELQREANKGKNMPPLPPTPLTPNQAPTGAQ